MAPAHQDGRADWSDGISNIRIVGLLRAGTQSVRRNHKEEEPPWLVI